MQQTQNENEMIEKYNTRSSISRLSVSYSKQKAKQNLVPLICLQIYGSVPFTFKTLAVRIFFISICICHVQS